MQTIPFYLSPAAQVWLSRLPDKKGEELGLMYFPSYGVSRGNKIIESFARPHYAFVHAKPEIWSGDISALRFTLCERPLWLIPEILRNLEGRMLEVIRVDVGRGRYSGRFREFLVSLRYEERA